VEEGAQVEEGQVILKLSNTNLQLELISREAQISEQLNNLRNTSLAIEQSTLNMKRDLLEVNLEISQNKRLREEAQLDFENGFISENEFKAIRERYEYFQERRKVLDETQEKERKIRQAQLNQLENTTTQLEENLVFARKNLENLVIRSPASGLLSFLDAEIGQSKTRGERLGQVDDPSHFKVTALVDEHYLTRVKIGLTAQVRLANRTYPLVAHKVYPQVTEGQFQLDLNFTGETPPDVRRGQSLQLVLQLGDPSRAILIARGSFFQDTGGDWIFHLAPDDKTARRRHIRLGRRNTQYFEVLEGLEPGDKVIVSSYGNFAQMDRVELK